MDCDETPHGYRRVQSRGRKQHVPLRFGFAEILLASDREVRLTDDGIDLPSESLAVLVSTAAAGA